MNFTAAIDISTFIWCKDDFEANTPKYYPFLGSISFVYDKIKELRLPVLFREELKNLIWTEFPYNQARPINPDFETSTLNFLIDTFSSWVKYDEVINLNIESIPLLVRPHFNDSSKYETQSQVNHLFTSEESHKFITYRCFYNHDNNLLLKSNDEQKEIDTLCYSSEVEINQFFDQFKIKFEHHKKHGKVAYYDNERKEDVSPFSCYHNQGETAAQKLLDEAHLLNGHYYNFDLENNVFVRFIKTRELIYHGHDLLDVGNNIPNAVKKKFHK
jgi:hypothetical protein